MSVMFQMKTKRLKIKIQNKLEKGKLLTV
jgi:hypothetical protein